MNESQTDLVLKCYERAIIHCERLRHFNSLKRLLDPLLEGGTKDKNEKAAKTYFCLLDELSYVYYAFDQDKRRLLKIENPDMVDIFKRFDQEETIERTSVDEPLVTIEEEV